MQSAPPPARGAPARPYFSVILESTYRSSAIQGSSRGYSSHQGQTSGQQSTILRACFECEDLDHMKRFCPELWGKAEQQDYRPVIIAPVVALAVRPPRGGGKVGRGGPRGGNQSSGAPSRFYAFPARPDAVASDVVITCIISICDRDVTILFDPGSMYSYVSSLFAHFLGVPRESLGTPLYVSTPVGDFVIVDRIYQSCIMTFCGYDTRVDLLLLDMIDFEFILGMDWLSPYHVVLDCHARHMVEKGCLDYLSYVRDTDAETPTINSVLVVREFSDVFPSDLLGMPPDRDIDFCTDLAPGTQPISIPPYNMALKELKEQLETLLVKGFVRQSVSPWGAPVLLVKKKDGTMQMCIDYH
ncbi:uncharacterized protein [Nicotiana tomentosiformis]|uniref:uncharacterized protein n=1 Tax=Nicotiana tomentosiformis TaxID=4098 RepID=UPI00388C7DE6